jgi:RNA-directed DNA polymerase
VDGQAAFYVTAVRGVEGFLDDLRADLKARRFQPLPVRERVIPKTGGRLRRLGIPTVRDRVAQAALKLVLEPIFEADFKPCPYGFRPKRRAQDAIAEIHFFTGPPPNYEWVLEGDITACFDEIDHTALMGRVADRIGEQTCPALGEGVPQSRHPHPGWRRAEHEHRHTPRGILSPLLANITLSVIAPVTKVGVLPVAP